MVKDVSMIVSFPSMRSEESNGEYDPPPKKIMSLRMMVGKIMIGNRKGLHVIKELPRSQMIHIGIVHDSY